jgi:transcriptional activator for dhaKLM operon
VRRRGVGKELLSQAIHNESERPYIAVNCQLYADSVLGQDFMGSAPLTMKMAA